LEKVILEETYLYARLALALAIGLVIGIERGWHTRDVAPGTRMAGVRTFTLFGVLGGLVGVAGLAIDDTIVAVGLFAFIVFIAVAYFTGASRADDRGMTTEVAAIITFVLGIIAVRGNMMIAGSSAVVVAALLDMKSRLHGWIANVESDELKAGIKLLLMSVVVLPLLPNEDLGPGGVLNPYKIWWVVVVIAGLSFAAYAVIRLAGPKTGAMTMGLLGGLASSTAVTVSAARMAAQTPRLAGPLGGAIALASAVMFLRVLTLSFVFFAPVGHFLSAPLIAAMLGALAVAFFLFGVRAGKGAAKPDVHAAHFDLGPPADIETAIKFGAILAAVAVAAHYGKEMFGSSGVFATAALSGLVDVDAVTITMSKFGQSGAEPLGEVATAIAIAIVVNSAAKMVYVMVIARAVLLKQSVIIFGVPVGAGAAAYFASLLL